MNSVGVESLLGTSLSQNFHQLILIVLPMTDELDKFLDSQLCPQCKKMSLLRETK